MQNALDSKDIVKKRKRKKLSWGFISLTGF